jgi:hypothetical protein
MLLLLLTTWFALGEVIGVAAPAPYCGAQDLNIGHGFQLLEYMFDGAPEFELTFNIPNRDVKAEGVLVANPPIRLLIGGLPHETWDSPRIGYTHFDVRGPDGQAFAVRTMTLDCGEGVSLSTSFPKQAHNPPRDYTFDSPFFEVRKKIPACLVALQDSGRLRWRFAGDDDTSLQIDAPLRLRDALVAEHRFHEAEALKAKRAVCRFMPAPPPPTIPPPTIPPPPPPPKG